MAEHRYSKELQVFILCIYTFFNSYFVNNHYGVFLQIVSFAFLLLLWIFFVGLNCESAIFSTIALSPSVSSLGGSLPFVFGSMTPCEIMMVVTVLLFSIKFKIINCWPFIKSGLVLVLVCFFSILSSGEISEHLGQFLRLILMFAFTVVILSGYADQYQRAVLYGILCWPLIVLSHVAGFSGLWDLLTFNQGKSLIPAESALPIFGGHFTAEYMLFLIPLFVFYRMKSIVVFTVALISMLMVLQSNSRSLLIACIISFLLSFFIANRDGKVWMKINHKFLIFFAIVVPFLLFQVGTGNLNINTDHGSKSDSNYIRIEKITKSFQTFQSNFFLGVGYGTAGIDSLNDLNEKAGIDELGRESFLDQFTSVRASAEFTPVQILAETGLLGFLASFYILVLSTSESLKLLRLTTVPLFAKYTILALVAVFLTGIIGSNFYPTLMFFAAIPFCISRIKWNSKYNSGF